MRRKDAPAGRTVALPSDRFYGERVFYRCDDGRTFRAVVASDAGTAEIQIGEDTVTLVRANEPGGAEVYCNGAIRLTIAPDGRAHLVLGPGDEMTSCEPLLSS